MSDKNGGNVILHELNEFIASLEAEIQKPQQGHAPYRIDSKLFVRIMACNASDDLKFFYFKLYADYRKWIFSMSLTYSELVATVAQDIAKKEFHDDRT